MVQVKALNCPNCGASIPDTSKACDHCGSRVILSDDRQKFVLAGTICPKCGLNNKDQNRFCSKCGDKLFKECPKCHREIGLDSLHCPFCGDNIDNAAKQREIDNAAKQREIALAKHKDGLSQIELLKQKVEQLEQKKRSLDSKWYKLIDQESLLNAGLSYRGEFFFFVCPIGALILSGIVYWMGIKSFLPVFIASYFGIFFVFHLLPSMESKKLKDERDLIKKEIEAINKDIQAKLYEISSLNATLYEIKNKYRT